MTEPDPYASLRESPTKVKILRLLWWYTAHGDYPTSTELAHQSDGRTKVPRATLHTRRVMVRELRSIGLIQAVEMPGSKWVHNAITPDGIAFLKSLDAKVAS